MHSCGIPMSPHSVNLMTVQFGAAIKIIGRSLVNFGIEVYYDRIKKNAYVEKWARFNKCETFPFLFRYYLKFPISALPFSIEKTLIFKSRSDPNTERFLSSTGQAKASKSANKRTSLFTRIRSNESRLGSRARWQVDIGRSTSSH